MIRFQKFYRIHRSALPDRCEDIISNAHEQVFKCVLYLLNPVSFVDREILQLPCLTTRPTSKKPGLTKQMELDIK